MIEIKNVSYKYADQNENSVKNINLSISKGECVLLCGKSGCGKTTVTRLINGLIPHFFEGNLIGESLLDGEKISEIPLYKLATRVGSVFQNPRTQFFNTDTDSELVFGLENEALPREQISERLVTTTKDLQLETLRQRNIFELSGGEKQKIAFASVYGMNPDIYLLDEPSSNLDTEVVCELQKSLSLIKKQGRTIIVAEHRLYYLMDIVDKVVYFKDGELFATYTVEEFKNLPDEERKKMGLRETQFGKENSLHTLSTHTNAESTLKLKNVTIYQKKKKIIEIEEFQAKQGEIIGIIGKNGVGKTTLSRTLCGLHKEYSGEISWQNHIKSRKSLIKLSYMVLQDVNYQLFADSVAAECSFGKRYPDKERIETIMKELNIKQLRQRHPNTLSGGERQRVAVAVSCVYNKQLLVFDEPTSGLDYNSMKRVAQGIRHLARQGKTCFVVSHDYEFVLQSCTRILQLGGHTILQNLVLNKDNLEKIKFLFFPSNR